MTNPFKKNDEAVKVELTEEEKKMKKQKMLKTAGKVAFGITVIAGTGLAIAVLRKPKVAIQAAEAVMSSTPEVLETVTAEAATMAVETVI